ncbi:WD40 repeat-like protein [Exidia glandulosa HHB12029]|uniref:WD40 repeat-like protein n=1 Tax=Exidia glandulosa HHB12029 TaxID=1314781 RepID=A0A165KLY5_EXIGL|nr:WD40 repeat-like protein [Exidia glandulosa HHB12029]
MWALTLACCKARPQERLPVDTLLARLRLYHLLYAMTHHAAGARIDPPEAVALLASIRRSASTASVLDLSSHQALLTLTDISHLDVFVNVPNWDVSIQPLEKLLRICVDRAACGVSQPSGGCMLATASSLISVLSHLRASSRTVAIKHDPVRLRPLATALACTNHKRATMLMQLLSSPAIGHPIHSHTQPVLSVTWLERGIISASWHESLHLHVHNRATGRTERTFSVPCSNVSGLVFSPDGLFVACYSVDGSTSLFDAYTGKSLVEPLRGHTGPVSCVSFSHNGASIVSAARDSTMRIWSVQTGRTIVGPIFGHATPVTSIAYAPDDTCIVSGSEDGEVHVWAAHNGTSARGPIAQHTTAVTGVAVSRDGKRIISSDRLGFIHVWNSHTRQTELVPLCGFKCISSFVFCPDDVRIALLSVDGIQIFNLNTGVILGPFKPYLARDIPLSFSPDGRYLVSCGWDDSLQIWDASGEYLRWDIP